MPGCGATSAPSRSPAPGSIATATLEETGYLGASFTNVFTLIHDDTGWRIASKTFTTTDGGVV